MCCLWHGEGKFLFILSLGKREMFGDGEGNGEGFLLWPACPGSPCAALRGKAAGLSLWWHPRRDAQGQACTKHFEQKGGGCVPSLMLLVIGHLGLLRLPGMLQHLNYRLGERNERFLQALLGIPAHLLLGLFFWICWLRHAGKDSDMVVVSASTALLAVSKDRRVPGYGIVLMCCLS